MSQMPITMSRVPVDQTYASVWFVLAGTPNIAAAVSGATIAKVPTAIKEIPISTITALMSDVFVIQCFGPSQSRLLHSSVHLHFNDEGFSEPNLADKQHIGGWPGNKVVPREPAANGPSNASFAGGQFQFATSTRKLHANDGLTPASTEQSNCKATSLMFIVVKRTGCQ